MSANLLFIEPYLKVICCLMLSSEAHEKEKDITSISLYSVYSNIFNSPLLSFKIINDATYLINYSFKIVQLPLIINFI